MRKATPDPRLVAETEEYIVIDKPPLLDSQNSREGRPSIVDFLNRKFGYSGLVHRLDFGASGLLVCAKTPASAKKLTDALLKGAIDRHYYAILFGVFGAESGVLDSDIEGQKASTKFRIVEKCPNATLVEVELETGRNHQIRRHFSAEGFPIIGDHLYKKKGSDRLLDRPALHAYKLKIFGETYTADMPEDMQSLLTRLRG